MKFDPLVWNEVKQNGKKTQIAQGRLRLRCSAPCPLYFEAFGVETLVGVSAEFDVQIAEAVSWCVDAPVGVRVFLYHPPSTSFDVSGDTVFSNIDQMPQESGSISEVTSALRLFKLEQQSILRKMRHEHELLDAKRQALIEEGGEEDDPSDADDENDADADPAKKEPVE